MGPDLSQMKILKLRRCFVSLLVLARSSDKTMTQTPREEGAGVHMCVNVCVCVCVCVCARRVPAGLYLFLEFLEKVCIVLPAASRRH